MFANVEPPARIAGEPTTWKSHQCRKWRSSSAIHNLTPRRGRTGTDLDGQTACQRKWPVCGEPRISGGKSGRPPSLSGNPATCATLVFRCCTVRLSKSRSHLAGNHRDGTKFVNPPIPDNPQGYRLQQCNIMGRYQYQTAWMFMLGLLRMSSMCATAATTTTTTTAHCSM